MTGATVTGPLTVVYTCSVPYPGVPGRPHHPGGVRGRPGHDRRRRQVTQLRPTGLGTGPFIYSEWQPNDHFTATRNPHYWRSGFPYLDSITYKPIPDTTQREATLRRPGAST